MPNNSIYNQNNFLRDKPFIPYTVHFGSKDKDLWVWTKSIPSGRFSIVIKDMIRAFYKKDKTYICPSYDSNLVVTEPFRKTVNIGKSDYDVFLVLNDLDTRMISHEIKEIIRYYVNTKTLYLNTPKLHSDNLSALDNFNIKLKSSRGDSTTKITSKESENKKQDYLSDKLISINNRKNKKSST